MTSTQDEREKHIASLRSLSAWLIANDHDMKLPDDVIDPDLAADFLASLPAPDTAAPCKHCGKGPRAYTHEPFDDSEHEYEPQAPDTSGEVRLMERFNAFLEIVKTFEPEKVALLEFGPEVKRLLERLAAPQAPATGGDEALGWAKATAWHRYGIAWKHLERISQTELLDEARAALNPTQENAA